MFVLKDDNRFEWPVDVEVPIDGGKTETRRFTAIFDVISTDTMEDYYNLPILEQDKAISAAVLVGWENVTGADKKPIPYSDETRNRMLRLPYVRKAVVLAYLDAVDGGKAAQKN